MCYRSLIITNYKVVILKIIHFPFWFLLIPSSGVFGDSYSLQVAANYLRRNIIIIPSKIEYAHNPYGYISIESFNVDNSLEPIYLFYYEEHVYGTGHYYQSIREGVLNAI